MVRDWFVSVGSSSGVGGFDDILEQKSSETH